MSTIKRNFAYQSIYQILTMLLPLITAPYIARVLGAENVGVYSYTYIIANYFVVFAMLGLEQYGNRGIAQVRDCAEEKNRVFSELVSLHLMISVFVALVYFAYVLLCTSPYKAIMLFQGIYVLSAVFDVNWFFFGIEKFKLTVTRNIIIKLISVAMLFLLVRDRNDLWVYTLIMALSTFVSQLVLWRYLFKYVSFCKIELRGIFSHLKPLLILFVAVIAAHIYRMIDKVMLGWFGQMADLGCYEYADKIIRIPLGLITALGNVMLSKMSNLAAHKDIAESERILAGSALFVIFLSVAMAFGIAGIAPEFAVIFLGNEYGETAVLMMILAVTVPMIGWNNFVRTQILIPMQQDKIYTVAVIAGAIVNFSLNVILIYFYRARGAAAATIFSYLTVMLIQMKPLWKTSDVKRYLGYLRYALFEGLVMFAAVRRIGRRMGVSIAAIVVEIITGALIYGLLFLIFWRWNGQNKKNRRVLGR